MSKRIVVADDQDDIRRLIVFTLKRRGYTCLEAADGEEALALIRSEEPDLVLLDSFMPGMTGLEVLRASKADASTSSVPIVLVSANGNNTEVEEGLAKGATAYIVKPFTPQTLATRVAEILGDAS